MAIFFAGGVIAAWLRLTNLGVVDSRQFQAIDCWQRRPNDTLEIVVRAICTRSPPIPNGGNNRS